MKNENKHLNLENKKGSITNVLSKALQTIYRLYEDMTVSAQDFKKAATDIVSEANSTPAQKKLLYKINTSNNKNDLLFLLNSTYMKGSDSGVLDINKRY